MEGSAKKTLWLCAHPWDMDQLGGLDNIRQGWKWLPQCDVYSQSILQKSLKSA